MRNCKPLYPIKLGLVAGLLALASTAPAQVSITEIMYNPGPAGAEGRGLEFVEIFNTTAEDIDLSGWYFSRGLTFVFAPRTWLGAGRYLVVCANPDTIRSLYSITNTAGPWSPDTSLANGGETIALSEPSGAEIVKIQYNDGGKWPVAADGTGHSLEIDSPYAEVDDPDSWTASRDRGGSPGKANPQHDPPAVVFNEALLWSAGERWVELYNRSGGTVDLAGMYLTDDPLDLTKAPLTGSLSVPAGGRIVFSDTELGLEFTPDAPLPGGSVFVALVDSSGERVIDAYNFEPMFAQYTEARVPDGDEDWLPAATPTPGEPNRTDVETDVVINEIMYHPIGDDESKEYVELYNRSASSISLDGCRFARGIRFAFPPGTSIAAGGHLVVARNPERVRAIYGLPASVVLGPAQDPESLDSFGRLADSGERITLKDALGNVMDTVRYYDGGDWPRWPDGLGSSLELVDAFSDNARAGAWRSSDDSAKAETQTFAYTDTYVSSGESELHFLLLNQGIAIIDDIAIRSGAVTIADDEIFVPMGSTWNYRKGTADPSDPREAWRQPDFDDAGWDAGTLPIGYGEDEVVTELADMRGNYLTFFCRKTFQVDDPSSIEKLFLRVRYDDGFIAYLNGEPLAMGRASDPAFDAPAASAGEKVDETIDITESRSLLRTGENVLAIQVHNIGLSSSDALLDARLFSGTIGSLGTGPNLVSNGTFDANGGAWIIEGNHIESGRTTVDPITGAGSLKLIATGRGDNKVNRIETETSPAMQGGQQYTVSFKARWVVGSRTVLTHGYQNLNTNMARSHQLAIPEDLGTPGTINSVTERRIAEAGTDNMGPAIWGVSQDPTVPGDNEPVTVRAHASDADGISSVKLRYFANSPGQLQPTEPQPVGIFYDHRDVGAPCGSGDTASTSDTRYIVTGAGADIWTNGDQFQFAYTYATGNFTMTARLAVKDWASGTRWGKVGIMARQNLSSSARYAMVQDHGADLQDQSRLAGRRTDGGSDNFEIGQGEAGAHPAWVRLRRQGNVFQAYGSDDGAAWTPIESMDWGASAPDTVLLGLAVCSHDQGCATTTITFDNVEISGTYGDPPPDGPGGGDCNGEVCEIVMDDPEGNGVFTAVIPGQPLKQKILFSIEGTDAGGNVERFPQEMTSRTHPLQLDATDGHPALQRYFIYRHDTANINPGSKAHKFRFVMHDLDEAYLDQRRTLSNDFVHGSFVFGKGDLYYNSRIRFSGSPWARSRWGSFRLRLPHDNPLHGEIFQMNLEQNQGGGSDGHQRLSHYLFRYLSRPYAPVPYDFPQVVDLWVNSRSIGRRSQFQAPNGSTLERWWPGDDDGDFFEIDDRFVLDDTGRRRNSRDAYLRYPPYGGSGDNKEEYRWHFNLRQDEDGDRYTNLINFAKVMDPGDTGTSQFDALIDEYANVENFLRIWAVRMNSDDWDTWGTNRGKNAYLYRPVQDGRWYLLPWDMELTYGNVDAFPHPTGSSGSFGFKFPEVNRMLNRPRIRRLYYGILKEMVDGPFRSSHVSAYMSKLDALGVPGTEAGKPGGYVDQRRSRILNWIRPVVSPQVTFAITAPSSGSDTTTPDTTVDLAGNAPVEVFQILVLNDAIPYNDGDVAPAEFSTSSMTRWSIAGVPLVPGVNNLTLLALGSDSGLVAQDSIRVTVTAGWQPPSLAAVEPDAALAGESVVITGADLQEGLKVYFGGQAASGVTFDAATDPTRIEVVVPDSAPGVVDVTVENVDGQTSNALSFTVIAPPPEFIRGDTNLDAIVDISDPVKTLFVLFSGHTTTCLDALDADDDGDLNLTDAMYTLNYLFQSGPAPAAPYPARGEDPTADALGCEQGL